MCLQRLCFQAAFASGLSLIFAGLLVVYHNSLPPFNPRLQTWNNLNPPGLGFRPSPKDPKSTLINFKHGYSSEDWKPLKVSVARSDSTFHVQYGPRMHEFELNTISYHPET